MLSVKNKDNLLRKMNERGEDVNSCARAIGISRQSFYQKMNGEREIKCSEIKGLCTFLNIDPGSEFRALFF